MTHPLWISAASGSLVDVDGTFFIQMGIFFAMMFLLHLLVFRPVLRLIAAREEATSGKLAKAAELRDQAAAVQRDVEERVAAERETVAAERARLVAEARAQERETLARAGRDAHARVEHAQADLAAQVEAVRRELAGRVDELADLAARRLLGRTVH